MASSIRGLRWYIVALLFTATLINYVDRQALSVAAPVLTKEFSLSERDYARIVMAFLLAYCVMQAVSGRILDWIGLRVGFAWAIVLWSLACMAHALARGPISLGVSRFFLGAFEAANYPAGIKAVGEWFPAKERTIATGIFSSGSGLGAIIAPPLIAWLILEYGWRAAFLIPGAAGLVWLAFWLWLYRDVRNHPRLGAEERATIVGGQPAELNQDTGGPNWRAILRRRDFWGLFFTRMLTDPVWWFYIFWLPKYLATERGFDLKQIAMFAWVPFLGADIFSILGGLLPAALIRWGMGVIQARKIAMLIAACCMPVAVLAVDTPSALAAILFITVATSGHTAFTASLLTLPADLFPRGQVASAYGLSAAGGTLGGLLLSLFVGEILGTLGYRPVFFVIGSLHLIGIAVVFATIRPTVDQGQMRAS